MLTMFVEKNYWTSSFTKSIRKKSILEKLTLNISDELSHRVSVKLLTLIQFCFIFSHLKTMSLSLQEQFQMKN